MNAKQVLTMVALVAGWNWLYFPCALADGLAPAGARSDPTVRLGSLKGRIRIEGTSNVDNWQVESRALRGFLEVNRAFPAVSMQAPTNPLPARAEVRLEVRSLKSIEKDGKPFSNKMDEIMYDALRSGDNPQIVFRLSRLTPKAQRNRARGPSEFETRGQLVVGGVTNEVVLPVSARRVGTDQIRVWGTTSLKMTDFRIEPPTPKITLGLIRTGDEVKLTFEWFLGGHE